MFKYVIPLIVFCFQSVVSENKVLCHPASIDSLTTSAGTEDHVSMGGFAARKCLRVVEHVEQGKIGFSYECRLNLGFFFLHSFKYEMLYFLLFILSLSLSLSLTFSDSY